MSAFQDMVANDLHAVFLELDEFGSQHMVDGKPVTIALDEDALKERQSGTELGIAESSLLFYAAVEDLPPRRAPGSMMNLDGAMYTIDDWSENMGMATIALSTSNMI